MADKKTRINLIIGAKDNFTKTFKKLQGSVLGFTRNLPGRGMAVGTRAGAFGILGAGTAIAAGASALTGIVKNAAAAGTQLQKLSELSNVSRRDFQLLTRASIDYGISEQKLADVLKDVNDKMGDYLSTGKGPLKDFFDQIAPLVGVTADEFRGLSSKEALQLYVSSLEKANVSQAQMTFYMEAIANDATLLAPLFRDNGKAIDDMSKSLEGMFMVLRNDELDELERIGGDINKMGKDMEMTFARTAIVLKPFSDLMSDLSQESMPELNRWLFENAGTLDNLAENFRSAAEGANELLDATFNIGTDGTKNIDLLFDHISLFPEHMNLIYSQISLAYQGAVRDMHKFTEESVSSLLSLSKQVQDFFTGRDDSRRNDETIRTLESYLQRTDITQEQRQTAMVQLARARGDTRPLGSIETPGTSDELKRLNENFEAAQARVEHQRKQLAADLAENQRQRELRRTKEDTKDKKPDKSKGTGGSEDDTPTPTLLQRETFRQMGRGASDRLFAGSLDRFGSGIQQRAIERNARRRADIEAQRAAEFKRLQEEQLKAQQQTAQNTSAIAAQTQTLPADI